MWDGGAAYGGVTCGGTASGGVTSGGVTRVGVTCGKAPLPLTVNSMGHSSSVQDTLGTAVASPLKRPQQQGPPRTPSIMTSLDCCSRSVAANPLLLFLLCLLLWLLLMLRPLCLRLRLCLWLWP